jgi:molecular chaperone GrpE
MDEKNKQEAAAENEDCGCEEEDKEEKLGRKVGKDKYLKALDDLAKANADRDHWKNEYYRAYADTQNLRKSLEEENRTAARYRAAGFVESLIPALDAFHMALANPAPTKEAQNYLIGFNYIYNQLVSAMANEGVSEISPKVGDDYDLNTMHAMEAVETDEVAPGKIVKVLTKGYRLHDRLIRPVMVTVSKAKSEEKKEDEKKEEKVETKEAKQA